MKKKLFLMISVLFVISMLSSCLGRNKEPLPPPEGKDGIVTILLDAGHGFGDPGCTSPYINNLAEYQLTYPYVQFLRGLLSDKGYNVLLTHDLVSFPSVSEISGKAEEYGIEYSHEKLSDNDVFDAYERAIYSAILNYEQEIDLMLSIHVNANADSDECTGFEVDYCVDKDCAPLTAEAFDKICDELEVTFPQRPLKRFHDKWEEAFIVTKYNPMPSILLETGFASTPSDGALLLDSAWQEKMLTSVANGIIAYFEGH